MVKVWKSVAAVRIYDSWRLGIAAVALGLLLMAIGIGVGAAIWAGTSSGRAAGLSQTQTQQRATSGPAPVVRRSQPAGHPVSNGARFVDSTGLVPGSTYVFKVRSTSGGQAVGTHVQIADGFWYRLCNGDQSVCSARVRPAR